MASMQETNPANFLNKFDFQGVKRMLESFPQVPSLLPSDEHDMFHNRPDEWLRDKFVETPLFHRAYTIAQQEIMNVDASGKSMDSILSHFFGALFEAYGFIYLSQSQYNQPGFSIVYGQPLFDLHHKIFPDAEVIPGPYSNSLQGITIPDAIIVAHDTKEGSLIANVVELTTTEHFKNFAGKCSRQEGRHSHRSLTAFEKGRQDEDRAALYVPSASLLYIVPKEFNFEAPLITDVLHVPATNNQWKEFITYIVSQYKSGDDGLSLQDMLGTFMGRLSIRNMVPGAPSIEVSRLLHQEATVEDLLVGLSEGAEWDRVRGFH